MTSSTRYVRPVLSLAENSVLKRLVPSQLYGEFDKHYSTWMAVIKAVAQLDCLLSLSKSSAALGEPCVRPEIVEAETAFADFEELRHPCIFR
jgi:DNA mismatch repair ATPase MutS